MVCPLCGNVFVNGSLICGHFEEKPIPTEEYLANVRAFHRGQEDALKGIVERFTVAQMSETLTKRAQKKRRRSR